MTGRGPAETIVRANDLILADSHSDLFVTLFYAILDAEQNRLIYTNAGHNPPLLVNGHQQEPQLLSASGIALGIIPDIQLEERNIFVEPGSLIVFYTDGVIDALDGQENEFGLKRLSKVIKTHHQDSAEQVVQAINRAVADFTGDQPQFDDFTLLVLKRQQT
jgi:sigma-B regulation protein RsbU (phosphoserine phosphatase)